ncbi:MAG: DUF1579 domain-containing protein [Tepidisphaeraceae bacterium]
MRTIVHIGLAVVAVALMSSLVTAEDKPAAGEAKQAAEKQAAGEKITPEQMMAAMQKYGTPGKEHEAMKPMVGTFDAEVTMQMDPTSPPMTSKGQTVNEMIFDGRYLKSDYKGDFAGAPFKGINLLGFDKMKEKYVALWADSMSTAMMLSEGPGDGSKMITLSGSYDCPITNGKKTMKQVVTVESPDKHTIEMYDVGPDGKEFKSMTIKYTRARAVPVP